MKALNLIALICGGIGLLLILAGLIQLLVGRFISGAEIVNYIHAANSFFLITIALFLFPAKGLKTKE